MEIFIEGMVFDVGVGLGCDVWYLVVRGLGVVVVEFVFGICEFV